LAASAVAAGPYTVIDLGTFNGGTSSFANDVNNNRQVTGNAQTAAANPSPRLNGYHWQGGTLTNLGVLPASNNFSRGYAIKDAGVLVGESDNNTS
jgi:probable HAF family extracellular repeat protein